MPNVYLSKSQLSILENVLSNCINEKHLYPKIKKNDIDEIIKVYTKISKELGRDWCTKTNE